MIVAGVMSGTSADGINVALVEIHGGENSNAAVAPRKIQAKKLPRPEPRTSLKFLGQGEFAYPPAVRKAVLAAMNASHASVADLARLNFLLGGLYADAVLATGRKLRVKAEMVGCHGQTLYHQGTPARYLGKNLAATWQTGEAAIIAARTGVPVVSDFRPADMAAGGKGAPLVPYLDFYLYRDAHVGRIAQNIGGIANLTAIPAGASPADLIAFDTGPGNMVIDALMEQLFGRPLDRGGRVAASGKVREEVVQKFLGGRFFRQKPPKTAGREQFGREFVREFLAACGKRDKPGAIATATALTARSISDAVKRFVLPADSFPAGNFPVGSFSAGSFPAGHFKEMIVSGGGTKNATLMKWLARELGASGIRLRSPEDFGVPSQAKEAVAFALLAYETWNRRPSNVPSATGAKRAAVLGKISFP
jgi:anhydro-N-acetylmuramic acid kinase